LVWLIVFDFTVLNDAVDFYIIEFDGFNECNDQFRGGIVPLCGPKSLVNMLYPIFQKYHNFIVPI